MYEFMKDFAGPLATMLQNLILAVGAYFAWRTIKAQQAVAAKRATLDMIHHLTHDERYNAALKLVNKMRAEERDSGTIYSDMKNKSQSEENIKAALERYLAATEVLKRLSIIANGIKNGSLDEQSFKEYYYSTLVETVEYLRAFILSIRQAAGKQIHYAKRYVSPETIYAGMEELLARWKASPLGKDHK